MFAGDVNEGSELSGWSAAITSDELMLDEPREGEILGRLRAQIEVNFLALTLGWLMNDLPGPQPRLFIERFHLCLVVLFPITNHNSVSLCS
jgi:hypothetical protein